MSDGGTRARMIAAGQDLLAMHGYGVTMLDVVERAQASRGSIYHHFPHGKPELAVEVARKVAYELDAFVAHAAARTDSSEALLQRLVDHHCKRLVASDYTLGCPLMGAVVTNDTTSPDVERAVEAAFGTWIGAIGKALVDKGVPVERAASVAAVVVGGIEGAIVLARARRSPEPFTHLRDSIPSLID